MRILFYIFILISTAGIAQPLDCVPYRKGNLFGYCDSSKTIVIQPQYTVAMPFYEGAAIVQDTTAKWGMINKRNEVLVPFIYDAYGVKPHLPSIISFNQIQKVDTLVTGTEKSGPYITRMYEVHEHRKIVNYALGGIKINEYFHERIRKYHSRTDTTTDKPHKGVFNNLLTDNNEWGIDSFLNALTDINPFFYARTEGFIFNSRRGEVKPCGRFFNRILYPEIKLIPKKSILIRKSDVKEKDLGNYVLLDGTDRDDILIGYKNKEGTQADFIDTSGNIIRSYCNGIRFNKISNSLYSIKDYHSGKFVLVNSHGDTINDKLPNDMISLQGNKICGIEYRGDSNFFCIKRIKGLAIETIHEEEIDSTFLFYQPLIKRNKKWYFVSSNADILPLPIIKKFPFHIFPNKNITNIDKNVRVGFDDKIMIGEDLSNHELKRGIYSKEGSTIIPPEYIDIKVFYYDEYNFWRESFFINGVALCQKNNHLYYLVTDKGFELNKTGFKSLYGWSDFSGKPTNLFYNEEGNFYVDYMGTVYYDK